MKKRKGFQSTFITGLLTTIMFLSVVSCTDSSDKKLKEVIKIDKSLITGDWVRTDASYLIRIIKFNDDGTMDVKYFNPDPINVGKANWEENNGNLKLIIELRDVNYPGSTYTLNYLPDKDMLAGDYFQAVEGLTFYVEFIKNK